MESDMKIAFIGAVDFSAAALEKVIHEGGHVVGVLTKESSSINSDFVDLTPICLTHGIPVRFWKGAADNQDCVVWLGSLSPDVIFCFGWSHLLPDEMLRLSPEGVIGFHPAALPQNRGRHPIIWALALGLEETASTFFYIDRGADSGDILSQVPITISFNDDASTLYEKITRTALDQIKGFLPLLAVGKVDRIPQDHALANTWRKRGREDGRIDFRMTANAVYNLVRALTRPYPGAHVEWRGRNISIWKAEPVENSNFNLEPGLVLSVERSRITVKCGEGAVLLLEHEFGNEVCVGDYL